MPIKESTRGRTFPAQQARRHQILKSVVDLLKEGGMAAVTTDAVAARSDVSKSTIYKYWSNKSEFVVAALDTVIQPLEVPDLGSLESEMRAFLEARCQQYSEPHLNRIIASVIGASIEDPLLAETFHGWVHGLMEANAKIVERGVQRGEVDPRIPLKSIVTMIAAPLTYRLIWEREAPTQDLVETVVVFMVRALRPE